MKLALQGVCEAAASGRFVVLDTETTGLDYRAEIVQIAIVDAAGQPLLDTFVRPTRRIPRDATAIHGITDDMVADAPTIAELEPRIRQALQGNDLLIYNADYDMRLLRQSARAVGLATDWRSMAEGLYCVMLAYAQYRAGPGAPPSAWRWFRLENAARTEGIEVTAAHSALADCLTTLKLSRRLAEYTTRDLRWR